MWDIERCRLIPQSLEKSWGHRVTLLWKYTVTTVTINSEWPNYFCTLRMNVKIKETVKWNGCWDGIRNDWKYFNIINIIFNLGKLYEEIIHAVIVHAMHRHLTWINMQEVKPPCDHITCYAQATDMKPCRIKPLYYYSLSYTQASMWKWQCGMKKCHAKEKTSSVTEWTWK